MLIAIQGWVGAAGGLFHRLLADGNDDTLVAS